MALLHGQISVTGSQQQLTSQQGIELKQVVLKALSSNEESVYVGNTGVTTSTGYPIEPGEEKVFTVQGNPSLTLVPDRVYVIGTAGSDKLAWLILT